MLGLRALAADTGAVRSLHQDESGKFTAFDDIKGGPLDPQKVIEARGVEMSYVIDRAVYRPSSRQECMQHTGKPPIATDAKMACR